MSFPVPSGYRNDHEYMLREHITILTGIMRGQTNNIGTVTLSANTTTTTITFPKAVIGAGTAIFLSPTTANAAAALTNVYQSSIDVANKTITLTHANTATTDRTFNYQLVG